MKRAIGNALIAFVYIVLVALIMRYGNSVLVEQNMLLAPIAMLCLFTLSAAVMGYLFLYKPFTLYLDGKKKEGATLFFQTVAIFAGITCIALIVLFSGWSIFS